MAGVVNSLFGIDPQQIQMQRQKEVANEAMQYAQLDPFQRAHYSIYQGAHLGGRMLGGLMGAQDPEMQRATATQKLTQEADFQTPQGLLAFAKQIQQYNPEAALQAVQKAQELRKTTALANKEELSAAQEAQLRKELAALGPNATQEQLLGVVTKYGDADKIMAQLNTSMDRAANRENQLKIAQENAQARLDAAKEAADARIEAARIAGESREAIARMQTENARLIAQMQADARRDVAKLAASLKSEKPPKPLHPSLQKQEDEDLNVIDGMKAQIETLAPTLQALQPGPNGEPPVLQLGALNNFKHKARNVASNSDPGSRAYAGLERAVQQATNIKVSAEKGVQTDSDVLRMANELIAAYGKNDNKVMAESLTNYINAVEKAQDRRKGVLQKRRETQRVEPFIFDEPSKPASGDGWSIKVKP